MKALVVDDERLARRGLRDLLRRSGITDIAEAGSVAAALQELAKNDIDVVFLDIQLRGEIGFEIFDRTSGPLPPVIFVTAYDRFALRAFEVNALDYLLKPVSPERLEVALRRLQPESSTDQPGQAPATTQLTEDDLIYCEEGNKVRFVRVSDIIVIQAAGNYTEIGLPGGAQVLVLKALGTWEQQLPQQQFVRVHRSTIVNVSRVREITRGAASNHEISLEGWPTTVQLSRRRASELRRALRR